MVERRVLLLLLSLALAIAPNVLHWSGRKSRGRRRSKRERRRALSTVCVEGANEDCGAGQHCACEHEQEHHAEQEHHVEQEHQAEHPYEHADGRRLFGAPVSEACFCQPLPPAGPPPSPAGPPPSPPAIPPSPPTVPPSPPLAPPAPPQYPPGLIVAWDITSVSTESIYRTCCHCNQVIYVKITPTVSASQFRLRFNGANTYYLIHSISAGRQDTTQSDPVFVGGSSYPVTIGGTGGSSNIQIDAQSQVWTDWISGSFPANQPILVTFFHVCGPDYYSQWGTSSPTSWVSGSWRNYVYDIDQMEVQ